MKRKKKRRNATDGMYVPIQYTVDDLYVVVHVCNIVMWASISAEHFLTVFPYL